MRGNVRPALAISLLLHFLLLWPGAPGRSVDDLLPPLTATLRAAPASPLAAAVPAAARVAQAVAAAAAEPRPAPLPRMTTPAAPVATTNAAPSTVDALPRSVDFPAAVAAVAAVPAAASPPAVAPKGGASVRPADGAADGMRQYRLALAVQARRFKRYPPRALEAGIGGTTEIRIDVGEGRTPEVALARSSGDDALDAAALDMIGRAAPRTAVPEALRGRGFIVSLPVVFDPAAE